MEFANLRISKRSGLRKSRKKLQGLTTCGSLVRQLDHWTTCPRRRRPRSLSFLELLGSGRLGIYLIGGEFHVQNRQIIPLI